MSRFNAPTATITKTENLAGGEAFVQSPKLEFVSILLTSMVQDQFYRKAEDSLARVRELIPAVGYEFAAQAALFARDEFGMRSISHVVAGELAVQARGETWTRNFYDKIVVRADDITEILSYVINTHGRRPIPNALKVGLGRALTRQTPYSLAKYRSEGKAFSMVDAVNLLHPQPSEAITALVKGTLRSTDTWETQLTQAGQQEGDKGTAWASLVAERKLGYLALLRNLRNILQDADEATLTGALEQLVNAEAIHKSRVFPFQFQTAADALGTHSGSKRIMEALAQAADIACDNVPKFDGSTLVVVDASASMQGSFMRSTSPIDIAAMFAGVLYQSQDDVDLMLFAEQASYAQPQGQTSAMGIAAGIRSLATGGGTNFKSVFETANRAYDRIIILSDMQGWMGYHTPTTQFGEYKTRVGANPHVYSFDLAGHGSMQFPEPQVYALAGFSAKVFDVMKLLEEDRQALVHRIEAVELA